ncbi:Betaine aldehyde dehydrogenase [Variovorax sp. PBS-H4]|uniref:aldehyde dehydrogenase family protein n=1 Tax=Variovorax sp. PBS-H4 TaxID=434008 RepID=UPI001317DE18|nr:aldehyde dehydrogenase family protein [Variovorax sp. PBS-H4]VTU32554.1 Betaine aldehyde dehydrogenase [Variovorax sp. PBS-H4]
MTSTAATTVITLHSAAEYAGLLRAVPEGSIYVDGRYVGAHDRHRVFAKADGAFIAEIGYASTGDVNAAVEAADAAFPAWAARAPSDRSTMLSRLADALERRSHEFAMLEAHHAGKLITDAELEIRSGVQTLRWFASCALHIDGRMPAGTPAQLRYVRREPLGVCSLILPWNFPLLLMLWKLGPALAAGNTVVAKPASETPLTALAFGLLCDEAGLPHGVYNVVPGSGREAGMALATHDRIAKVSFTGSTSVGLQVAAAAARTVKRVTLELGGKSPNIVCDDADLDRAAAGIAGIFGHAGQKCAARTRCFVQESVADRLVEKVAARASALRIGDPLDRAATLGPVINSEAQETILGYCRSATEEGARLVCGGKAPVGRRGPYVEPTVFDHARNDMTFAREEIFGPVLAVIRIKDIDEAILLANDSVFGLAASVWTGSLSKAHTIAARLEAGSVSVNTPAVIGIETPFGGYKQSGLGRELGVEGLDAYLQHKSVIVDLG